MFSFKEKPSYGLDAPLVIRIFIILTIFYIAISGLFYHLLYDSYPVIAILLAACVGFSALFFGIVALLMIRSSFWGKISLAKRIANSLELKGDEKILDLGCGRGLFMNTLAKSLTTGKAVGVDIWNSKDLSGNSEQAALRNAELEGVADKVEVHTADIRNLPFENDQFDMIVSNLVIHNIRKKEERERAVIEACRVLKPGGKLVMIDFKLCREYAETLLGQAWKEIDLTKRTSLIIPPVRILRATKPV